MGNGLVYFVTYDNVAWRATLPVIKIGATTDLPKRLSSLSVSSPIKLLVAGTIAAKDPYPLEKSLHRAFQRDRLNGEWFKLNSKMLDAIRLHPIVDDRFKTRWGAGVADSRLFRGGRSVPRCYLFRPRSG